MTLKDYFQEVRSIAISSGVIDNPWKAIQMLGPPQSKYTGKIRARLHFKWGDKLEFLEDVSIDPKTGQVNRQKYYYHYVHYLDNSRKYYFRYERDKEAALNDAGELRYDHPEYHLHANRKEPRYMAKPVDFKEVLQFIMACFAP